jgi:ABC-2 type transport system ATP-binding protein
MALAIETTGLARRFGAVRAVDGIDLAVPEGSVFGFLGPNGSGKTTTIRMLVGLVRPTAGSARVLGEEVAPGASVVRRLGAWSAAGHPFLSPVRISPCSASRHAKLLRAPAALIERVGYAAADRKVVRLRPRAQRLAIAWRSSGSLLIDDRRRLTRRRGRGSSARTLARATIFRPPVLIEVEQSATGSRSYGRIVTQAATAERSPAATPSA